MKGSPGKQQPSIAPSIWNWVHHIRGLRGCLAQKDANQITVNRHISMLNRSVGSYAILINVLSGKIQIEW